MHFSAKKTMRTMKQENGKLIWGQNKTVVKEMEARVCMYSLDWRCEKCCLVLQAAIGFAFK